MEIKARNITSNEKLKNFGENGRLCPGGIVTEGTGAPLRIRIDSYFLLFSEQSAYNFKLYRSSTPKGSHDYQSANP